MPCSRHGVSVSTGTLLKRASRTRRRRTRRHRSRCVATILWSRKHHDIGAESIDGLQEWASQRCWSIAAGILAVMRDLRDGRVIQHLKSGIADVSPITRRGFRGMRPELSSARGLDKVVVCRSAAACAPGGYGARHRARRRQRWIPGMSKCRDRQMQRRHAGGARSRRRRFERGKRSSSTAVVGLEMRCRCARRVRG